MMLPNPVEAERLNISCAHIGKDDDGNERVYVVWLLGGFFDQTLQHRPDLFRVVRKKAVAEREEWTRLKKEWRGDKDLARFAKENERIWLRHERAATHCVRQHDEGLPISELSGELAFALSCAACEAVALEELERTQ